MKSRKLVTKTLAASMVACLSALPLAAHSDEREDLEKLRATVLSLIDTLVKSGVVPRDKADAMMREAQRQANVALAKPPPPEIGADGKKIIRVPYVPEAVRVQMRDEIKTEVLAQTRAEGGGGQGLSELGSRIRIGGDLRVRAETIRPNADNTAAPAYKIGYADVTRAADIWGNPNFNTQGAQSRSRVRARLNVDLGIADSVSAAVSLTTGNSTGPTSTNQTMAQGAGQTPGYFNKYSAVIDRASIRYQPASWFSADAGRFRNPYLGTDLLWADDLNFEGFALALKPRFSPAMDSFVTAGWFPLSFGVPGQSLPRSLLGLQAGLNWQLGQKENRIKLAAALYDYSGVEGIKQTTLDTSKVPTYLASEYGSGYRQRGNTLFRINTNPGIDSATNWGLASAFRELNLTAVVDVAQFDPLHVILTTDIVRNLGFKRSAVQARSKAAIADGSGTGFMVKVQIGAPLVSKPGDWNTWLAYRRVGSDAVIDAFTNSDFGLGGTNNKGMTLGASYGVAKNTWLTARWMSSDLLDSMVPMTTAATIKTKFSIDTLQFELNTRF